MKTNDWLSLALEIVSLVITRLIGKSDKSVDRNLLAHGAEDEKSDRPLNGSTG